MKIATITFHAPNNNGSFFQAHALQHVLCNYCKVENEIIDFQSEKQKSQYSLLRPIHSVRDVAKNSVSLMHYKAIKARNIRFDKARNHYLNMTEECSTVDEVKRIADQYDTVIAGSDQIWNTTAPDFSPAYMLPDVTPKKIAYGVSLGSVSAESELKKYKKYLKEFSAISVREYSAKRILEELLDRDVDIVLDPTLLLEREQYDRMCNKEPLIEGDYIFFYSISYPSEVMKTVKEIANRLHMKVVTVFTSFHTIICERYGIEVRYDAGPREFLNLIKNAKLVLTNSFHGTAFSIIFNKPFYYVCKTVNGKLERDDRINGLLEELGIDGYNIGQFRVPEKIPVIDWKQTQRKLGQLKNESIGFLTRTI